jgi:transglutaminase-like putative cysteine protease
MQSLTIRHLTTYRYRQPVSFGEHRMMLRPRDQHDQKVVEAQLGITPEPASLRFVQDAFGNHVAIAQFAGRARELSFESIVSVEHFASDAAKGDLDHSEFAACAERLHPDPADEVARWARQFLPTPGPATGSPGTEPGESLEFLSRLARGIHTGFRYRRREAKGIQTPLETLRLGRGTCRDFALLMVEAARALGLAARFVSGYLATPLSERMEPSSAASVESPHAATHGATHGATHAWAQVYLPDIGWVDFDPTAGSVGKTSLITVAVVCDPYDALPLHGTYAGAASDFLGMDVRVSVTPGGAQEG